MGKMLFNKRRTPAATALTALAALALLSPEAVPSPPGALLRVPAEDLRDSLGPAPVRSLVLPAPTPDALFRHTFRVLRKNVAHTDRYDAHIVRHARARKLDPRLLKAIIAAESEFHPNALSPAGAVGLMQLMPRTAEWMGVPQRQLRTPERNIAAGAAYLEHLFGLASKKFGLRGIPPSEAPLWVVQRVVAGYNGGPRFIVDENWYRETRGYVKKVLLFYQDEVADIRAARLAEKRPSGAISGLLH